MVLFHFGKKSASTLPMAVFRKLPAKNLPQRLEPDSFDRPYRVLTGWFRR
jgi:hypothetical protein